MIRALISLFSLLTLGCYVPNGSSTQQGTLKKESGIILTNLLEDDPSTFDTLRAHFQAGNPGYDIGWISATKSIDADVVPRTFFVQTGGGTATLHSGETSKVSVGDILMIRPGVHFTTDSVISYLWFGVPDMPEDSLPTFIRPDWDDQITDTPGGCATETGAYRRILLTWLGRVGPYLYHSLNAHRVRISDSFTHYHPVEGGFDEFYLVQMVQPQARLISSPYVEEIEHFEDLNQAEATDLLTVTPLAVGDLVYIPRGVAHRGLGGVLAQVITIPGFKPQAEIGLDYHLRKINEHLKLVDQDSLPYHYAASDHIVIK